MSLLWKCIEKVSADPKLKLFALGSICCVAYFKLLLAQQTMNPDAYFILPLFDRMQGLDGYLDHLWKLQTIDIQPVRDLSLIIDWELYKHSGFNLSMFHNVLVWVICCHYVTKVLEQLFPKLSSKAHFFSGLCYSIYPLFSGSVSWGIARKHLLAFLFIVLAIHQLLKFLKADRKRHLFWMNGFYFLSVFSQPIGILWPFWACAFVFYFHRERWPSFRKALPCTMGIFLFGFAVNYLYYVKSSFFASIFASKTAEAFDFKLKAIALGHYLHQLFSPYSLAFPYPLDTTTSAMGFLYCLAFMGLYLYLKMPLKDLLLWSLFALLPLGIILNTPRLLLDPYLLIPSLALLILCLSLYERLNWRFLRYLTFPLLLTWGTMTFKESSAWTDEADFAARNFERSPICINAIRLARNYYALSRPIPASLKAYFRANQCIHSETSYGALEMQVFISQTLYFEDDFTLEQKLRTLENLGQNFFYAKLVHAALQVRLGNENEAARLIQEVVDKDGNLVLDTAADPIIPTVVTPFCRKIAHAGCLRLTEQVRYRRVAPYF